MTARITVDDFIQYLSEESLTKVVEENIFRGVPYVFREAPQSFDALKNHLNSELGIKHANIQVVGSAGIGFSLNPHNFPRKFSDESDIDVLLVDERLFDDVWKILLNWHYPIRFAKSTPEKRWFQRPRNAVFEGWIELDRIQYEGITFPKTLEPLRDISARWFNTFKSLSTLEKHPELTRRNVNGRLFRTWDHAALYYEEGLRIIKTEIQLRFEVGTDGL